jgi:hypothetical protein
MEEMDFSIYGKVAGGILLTSLTGCASIVTGTTQPMAVETRMASGQDVTGVYCRLTNSKGTWFVTTPGTVTIHRATMSPLAVNCTKEGHEQLGVANIKPKSKGMTWGNLLFGGVIGVITDGVTGAAGYYPSPITVIMNLLGSVSAQPTNVDGQAAHPVGSGVPQTTPQPTTAPAGADQSNWRNWGKEGN